MIYNKTTVFDSILKLVLVISLIVGIFPVFAQHENKQDSLDKLFEGLALSTSERQAKQIEQLIWAIWFISDDEEVDAILQQLVEARQDNDYEKALEYSNRIIELKPDFAEGWNQRATIEFLMGNYEKSLQDIVETLKREPRHFGALSGRAFILLKQNKNREAIETINAALKIHPFLQLRHIIPNIKQSEPL